ncbi:MAG TPA: PPC domain-containing DNA-binding protein [Hyphomicrobiaceae bacterium]|nr:PPC domain-containing DNA-binding protein [Hyphomicrobiaceae bacterium]
MQSKLLHEQGGQRTFALILQTGDEAMGCLQRFAESERLTAAQVTAIGAFERARIAYFDWESKRYVPIPVTQQVEVASLIGDIAVDDGRPSVHVHAVLGRRDGTTMAGHLQEGHVRPTLETIITEQPAHLRKVKDAETGLALIRPRL